MSSPSSPQHGNGGERPRFFGTKAKASCWANAETVPGRHPERWRKDAAGNIVCKRFCNCQGCLCFEYDHIIPFSKGVPKEKEKEFEASRSQKEKHCPNPAAVFFKPRRTLSNSSKIHNNSAFDHQKPFQAAKKVAFKFFIKTEELHQIHQQNPRNHSFDPQKALQAANQTFVKIKPSSYSSNSKNTNQLTNKFNKNPPFDPQKALQDSNQVFLQDQIKVGNRLRKIAKFFKPELID